MNLLRRLSFELWYLGRPPWESGIVPPEVGAFLATHMPGRALDLGCGSGTSSLALARAGWTVSGVDFSARAIRLADKKARLAGLTVDFLVGDVTRLAASIQNNSYELALDIGCFHSLTSSERRTYLAGLIRWLAPGGSWLMYGFFKPQENPFNACTADELLEVGKKWKLVWRQDGLEKEYRPSAWFCFQAGNGQPGS